MVAGLLAGVAGVVVCVWAVEGGSPGLGSKEKPVLAQADDSLVQERHPGPAADPPPADQAIPQAAAPARPAKQAASQRPEPARPSGPAPGGEKPAVPPPKAPAAGGAAGPTAAPAAVPTAEASRPAGPPPKAAAPPEPPRPAEPAGARLTLKRWQRLDDEELRAQLLRVPEVDLDAMPNTAKHLLDTASQLQARGGRYVGPAILQSRRPDLAGLPLRKGQAGQLGKDRAEALHALSRKLRPHLGQLAVDDDRRPDFAALRRLLLDTEKESWLTPEAVPVMTQMFQAEGTRIRLLYAEVLGRIRGSEASEALARRAVLDLSPEVRERAILGLRERPRDEYVPLLLGKLRYPWAPVAGHAAEAIVALGLKETIPELVRMLDEPDPTLPTTDSRSKYLVVPELVRINHLRNCVLCHAPSSAKEDLVRASIPDPGQPLSTTPYYDEKGPFVRADVTYLRQDFSVVQPVENHKVWPAHQRFDYLVRQRLLTPLQATELLLRKQKEKGRSPQREAVLFALRELTDTDLGSRTKAWLSVLPPEKRPKPSEKQR